MPKFIKTSTYKKQPKVVITSTAKGGTIITYKMNSEPEDVIDDRRYDEIGPVEINDPTPDISNVENQHHHYEDCTAKRKKKVVYRCDGGDDDYIEVPGGSDTVPYTDEDGNQYEIPLDDLIEYDGDDGEIQYTKGKKPRRKLYMGAKNTARKIQNMQAFMTSSIINGARLYN